MWGSGRVCELLLHAGATIRVEGTVFVNRWLRFNSPTPQEQWEQERVVFAESSKVGFAHGEGLDANGEHRYDRSSEQCMLDVVNVALMALGSIDVLPTCEIRMCGSLTLDGEISLARGGWLRFHDSQSPSCWMRRSWLISENARLFGRGTFTTERYLPTLIRSRNLTTFFGGFYGSFYVVNELRMERTVRVPHAELVMVELGHISGVGDLRIGKRIDFRHKGIDDSLASTSPFSSPATKLIIEHGAVLAHDDKYLSFRFRSIKLAGRRSLCVAINRFLSLSLSR